MSDERMEMIKRAFREDHPDPNYRKPFTDQDRADIRALARWALAIRQPEREHPYKGPAAMYVAAIPTERLQRLAGEGDE